MPYAFHLRRNSAQLIRNIVNEITQYIFNVIGPMMMILTEVIVVTGILCLLIALEPLGTCSVGAMLSIVGIGYYFLTYRKSAKLGEKRVYHEGLRIQHIQQSLGGIKEIKLLGCEEHFLKNYQTHNQLAAHVTRQHCVMVQLPRLALEVVGVASLGALLALMIFQVIVVRGGGGRQGEGGGETWKRKTN